MKTIEINYSCIGNIQIVPWMVWVYLQSHLQHTTCSIKSTPARQPDLWTMGTLEMHDFFPARICIPKDPGMSKERDYCTLTIQSWGWDLDHQSYYREEVWILRASSFLRTTQKKTRMRYKQVQYSPRHFVRFFSLILVEKFVNHQVSGSSYTKIQPHITG